MTNHLSVYANTHILRNKKKKFADSICSLRITLSLEVQIFGGIAHVTQILQWIVAGCSRQTKKSKRGELVLHRKDQSGLLEISYRQEDRYVNLMVWFQKTGEVDFREINESDSLETLSNLDFCIIPLWHVGMSLTVECCNMWVMQDCSQE